MTVHRMTWLGLLIVALGWAVLAAGGPLINLGFGTLGRPLPGLQLDFAGIGHGMMISGFGVAILATLQSGFGALNRFFEAVLLRSAGSARPQPARAAPVSESPVRNEVAGRGRVKDRRYTLFADGSVDVETLLGTRRFSSLEEAREFIS